ncbi:hypothetical protein [Halospeciosus flavus]|uniref:hypothetical protein n=1 Tax=Halospeciosus flavus TaxID=3032283 RepID=UPI0036D23136
MSEVHETIQKFLDGEIANLGEALSGVLGGDQAVAQDEHANESGNVTTTTTPQPTTTSDDASGNTTTTAENTTTTTTTTSA